MKKRRWIALALCAAMLASTALTGCGGGDKPEGGKTETQAQGGSQTGETDAAPADSSDPAVYTELYSSECATLNYLVTSNTDEMQIGANCIDTLVEYDSKGQLKEGLATEWSYDEASLTWTFKLRDAK